VNTHRKNILHKLQLKNAAGIVKFALENNMI
jgi:DNA-binding CsgD family transcriptional regulator